MRESSQIPETGSCQKQWYSSWQTVVEEYSRTQLTRTGDKLLAVSGLAKEFRQVLKDRYLAGLWERNLLFDLLWAVSPESTVSLKSLTYRAPTWSWASLDAGIDYRYGERMDKDSVLAKLVDAQLAYATQDDTGLVTGGRVRMQGRLCRARFNHRGCTGAAPHYITNGIKAELAVYLDFSPVLWKGRKRELVSSSFPRAQPLRGSS